MKTEESDGISYDGREGSRSSKIWSTRAQTGEESSPSHNIREGSDCTSQKGTLMLEKGGEIKISSKNLSVQNRKETLILEEIIVFLWFSIFHFFMEF